MNLKTTRFLSAVVNGIKFKSGIFYGRKLRQVTSLPFIIDKFRPLSMTVNEIPWEIPEIKISQLVPESNLWLNLTFSDGRNFKFLHAWLRDECKCEKCWDDKRRFKRSDSWLPDLELQPKSFSISDEGHLEIIWKKDNHKSIFNAEWLLERGDQMSENKIFVTPDQSHRPCVIKWDRNTINNYGLPKLTYENFMKHEQKCVDFLHLFNLYGFAILYSAAKLLYPCIVGLPISIQIELFYHGLTRTHTKNYSADTDRKPKIQRYNSLAVLDTPLEKSSIVNFANRIAYIRESSFGAVAEVLVGPETNLHPAYSGEEIKFHTDLTYREKSPGILCMHCIKAADPETNQEHPGGETELADGIQAANWVKKHNPTAYHILTTVPLPYSYFDPVTGVTYSSYWPVIGLDPLGNIREIHFSNFARTTLNFSPELTLAIYSALKSFCDRLEHPESKINFYLHSGDLLVMNNRRVLHARSSFDPNKVQRHMRTIYMDLDEVMGTYDAILKRDNRRKLFDNSPQLRN